MREFPLISIIMPTYNRAHTLEQAIDSVLKQTYIFFELIIIDDGSTDESSAIIEKYNDHRIRVFRHEKNKGVAAAKNLGLKNIKGEWFTTFDSDDEMVPEALESLMNVPFTIDAQITAVKCNGWDTAEKRYTGIGLDRDCYLDIYTLINLCKGDFWGISKTELLKNEHFNENLNGMERLLWFKLDERANSYYIHKALLLIHTEGNDRISTNETKFNLQKEVIYYKTLINESHYLNLIYKYKLNDYLNICKNGIIIMRASKNNEIALKYLQLFQVNKTNNDLFSVIYKYWIVAYILMILKKAKRAIRDILIPIISTVYHF